MKAMLLAAGLGERMLPLTSMLPKPTIPVLGRSMARQIVRRLARFDVSTVTLNLHHLPDRVRDLVGDGTDLGVDRIHYSPEETLMGTAGGLRVASRHLRGGGTILVSNSDFLSDIDVREAVASHLASGRPATLVLAPHRPGYSSVEIDSAGRVLSIAGNPEADPGKVAGSYLFTGCHLMEEDVLDLIPEEGPSDIVRDVYRGMVEEGKLASHVHEGFWWEFGSLDQYLEGSLRLLDLDAEQRREVAETDPVHTIPGAVVAIGPGADFHSGGIEIRGRVGLGFASRLSEGSSIADSIVMNEAWIGPGARLTRVVVAPGAEVPAEFEAENALLCPDLGGDAPLPPDTERSGGLLVRRVSG